MTHDGGERIIAALIHVPDGELIDLRRRLSETRWPERETVGDWSEGAPLSRVQALCDYWLHRYDWRRCEAMLNGWNPQATTLDGLSVTFFHIRSPEPDALPMIMTHGWPGSVVEFNRVVGPLTDPVAHGGDARDAFHLVLPCLPGYGFSGKPASPSWTVDRIARAWSTLRVPLDGNVVSPSGQGEPARRRRRVSDEGQRWPGHVEQGEHRPARVKGEADQRAARGPTRNGGRGHGR